MPSPSKAWLSACASDCVLFATTVAWFAVVDVNLYQQASKRR